MAAREPLVLAAGLLCDQALWTPVAERLGGDTRIRSFAGFSAIGAMAEALLDGAPEHFALAGHSMGARVALAAYARAPERVTRLALLNTGIHAVQPHEHATRGRLVRLAQERGMAALAAEWLPPMLGCAYPDPDLLAAMTAMVERQTPEDFARQIAALLDRPNAEAALRTVRVPTLLLSATNDRWSPVAQHEAMLDLLPGARLAIVEDAGHMAPMEQPDAVAAAMRAWLEEAR